PGGAADVALRVGVPHPGEGERRLAVGRVAARLPDEVAAPVVHVVVEAELDSADGVDDVPYARHADLDVVVHGEPGDALDRCDEQLRPTVGVGGVERVAPVPGDLGERVAGQGDEHRRAGARLVHEHDRVGALTLDRVPGGAVGPGVGPGEEEGRARGAGCAGEGRDVADPPVGPD